MGDPEEYTASMGGLQTTEERLRQERFYHFGLEETATLVEFRLEERPPPEVSSPDVISMQMVMTVETTRTLQIDKQVVLREDSADGWVVITVHPDANVTELD